MPDRSGAGRGALFAMEHRLHSARGVRLAAVSDVTRAARAADILRNDSR